MISENTLPKEAEKKTLMKLNKILKMVDRENWVYRTNEYTYSFKKFWTINTIDKDIYHLTITIKKLIKIKVFY